MIKTPVKFQKDRSKTVGGVALTRFLLQTRNHAPWKAEYYVPSLFFEKAGDNKQIQRIYVPLLLKIFQTRALVKSKNAPPRCVVVGGLC